MVTAFFRRIGRGLRRSGIARLPWPCFIAIRREPRVPSNAIRLQAKSRTLEINGKAATLMGLEQANGKQGLSFVADQPFNVLLENKLSVPTAIHWHGLHPPNNQDGVPGLTQPVIAPNTSTPYNFPGAAGRHSLDALPPGPAGGLPARPRRSSCMIHPTKRTNRRSSCFWATSALRRRPRSTPNFASPRQSDGHGRRYVRERHGDGQA